MTSSPKVEEAALATSKSFDCGAGILTNSTLLLKLRDWLWDRFSLEGLDRNLCTLGTCEFRSGPLQPALIWDTDSESSNHRTPVCRFVARCVGHARLPENPTHDNHLDEIRKYSRQFGIAVLFVAVRFNPGLAAC